MAEGLRVRHTVLRGPLIVAVRSMKERAPNPTNAPWPGCSICKILSPGHEGYKTRHVEIDADGYGLVSVGVWRGLQRLDDHGGFELVNTITNPPHQEIIFGAHGETRKVIHHKMTRPIVSQGKK